ncbi:M48 family metallopeptidase [Xenophilus sp. Marseille-Q4582]|uniref:M48 family metallopeptidase n=1 Tax=Xenophilus sp. Marseille-Q4582 TaxID=2866600 RepID=UPI001CE48754|nr:M48 family metallopeptidase [Xenophilus sp. Marseille-Q4582]
MTASPAPAAAPAELVPARWFDGIHSTPQPVLVGLRPGARGPGLQVHPLNTRTPAPPALAHDAVDWPETWSGRHAPRRLVVGLGPHGSLEIEDATRWQAALQAAGARPGLAQRMQTRWQVFATVLLLSVLGLVAFYRWGTPWAATQLTRFVPLGWEQTLSEEAMRELDDGFLRPSRLPAERQAALQARFEALDAQWRAALAQERPGPLARYRGYAPPMKLALRSGMPANAFALPGGQIVMTDALVRAAERAKLGDDALAGVLAHEMGHVVHRHGTRLVVEQGVLNVGLGLALGDVSSLVATASTVLTHLAYRRDHEREADCFAVALMRQAGLPVAPMADLLQTIDGPPRPAKEKAGGAPGADGATPVPGESAGADWFSSHPDTAGRAQALRAGQGCPP